MELSTPFVLASGSPRRKELLAMCGFSFTVAPNDADETLPAGIAPGKACELLARRKAAAALPEANGRPVVAADTVVFLDGNILGKPTSQKDAIRMLSLLSGKTHQVYTGVCIMQGNREETFSAVTSVTFFPLSEKEILDYIRTGEPMDKAGAYGIQGKGALLVRAIDGDFYNVVGFPLSLFYRRYLLFGS